MGKIYVTVGYSETVEKTYTEDGVTYGTGVWETIITEVPYYGDLVMNLSRLQAGSNINDNIRISNQFSILADPFAYENFQHMLYVKYLGTKWKIESVEVQYPRLILNAGGVYNADEQTTPTT